MKRSKSSTTNGVTNQGTQQATTIIQLVRRAAVAVLQSGPWMPDKSPELVIMQVGALGTTQPPSAKGVVAGL